MIGFQILASVKPEPSINWKRQASATAKLVVNELTAVLCIPSHPNGHFPNV
jgi:hypothetical protein